jgi:hypothetical protein
MIGGLIVIVYLVGFPIVWYKAAKGILKDEPTPDAGDGVCAAVFGLFVGIAWPAFLVCYGFGKFLVKRTLKERRP